ncbi:hemolysin family protein [Pleomorphomonas koreensis]|uniref:hemolysin family protein n=1 Tax=Pleomorphomonas koreensis TaxID=257440 RepID=UPI00042392E3|nr:hemolysin family protein [Pleomorphomonas koreensis]
MGYLFEIGVIFILLILNGLFAMSELAVVSSRRPRLEAMASKGSKGAATVLKLAADPGRFLSSVQIGITLVGILAGAYSGATLSEPLSRLLLSWGVSASAASPLSIALVVGLITYFSLVIGELVPKQIALANPEAVASLMARPMLGIAFIAAPAAFVLERSSRLIIASLGLKATGQSSVTDEEIKAVIAEGTSSGILEPEEKELMAGVMRLADRSIRAVMIPRPDITGIDLDWDDRRIIEALANSSHSRYPVFTGSIDMVQGVIQAKDLLDQHLKGEPLDIRSRIRQVDMVPDTASALDVLDTLRRSPLQMVMVIDEYGSVEGMVTAADILTAIVGNLGGEPSEEVSEIVERVDGSWLIDADLGVDLVAEKINCQGLNDPDRDYETLAGFVLSVTKAIPATGDVVDWRGWTFEIVDMDGRRIDKVLVTAPQSPQG